MTEKTSVLGDIHSKTVDGLGTKSEVDQYLAYRKEFELAANFEKVHTYPIHVDIEIDNFCNFACTFCPIGQPENKFHEQYKTIKKIDKNKIFELLDECKKIGVKSVQFSLVNEPLANKNIFEYINYASRLNIVDISIVSNAYLLSEKNIYALLNSGLKKIQFSLDSFSPETYKERRLKNLKPANYQKTVNNILNFLKIKKEKKKTFPLVRVSFIELDDNKHEKNNFFEFWSDKVDAIHFQKLIDYTNDEAKKYESKTYKCNMPIFRLSIKADGNVKPCCVTYGEEINLGNIYNQSLNEIWQSKFLKDFQKLHLDSRANENSVCLNCINNTA